MFCFEKPRLYKRLSMQVKSSYPLQTRARSTCRSAVYYTTIIDLNTDHLERDSQTLYSRSRWRFLWSTSIYTLTFDILAFHTRIAIIDYLVTVQTSCCWWIFSSLIFYIRQNILLDAKTFFIFSKKKEPSLVSSSFTPLTYSVRID